MSVGVFIFFVQYKFCQIYMVFFFLLIYCFSDLKVFVVVYVFLVFGIYLIEGLERYGELVFIGWLVVVCQRVFILQGKIMIVRDFLCFCEGEVCQGQGRCVGMEVRGGERE